MAKKSPQVLAAEKRRQTEQEAKDTLRRETRNSQLEKLTPPSELGVVNNLRNAAQDGARTAKEFGARVVEGAKNMGSKAGKALKTLQNPTAAKKALEEARKEREARPKAKGGSVKKMAYGGKAMKMAEGGSLPMVKKGGKMVPAFAADGVGKMSYGGKVKKMSDGKMVTKKKKTATVARRRGDGCAVRGKTKGRMV